MSLPVILSFTASGLTLLLTVAVLAGRDYSRQKAFFIMSASVLTAQQLFQGLMLISPSPALALARFQVFMALTILLPAFTTPFFLFFARDAAATRLSRRLPGIAALTILLLAAAVMIRVENVVREISFTENGSFWGMTFSGHGKGLGAFLILANVFILYYMENTYRSSTVPSKVTLKYPALGIMVASMINLIVIGRILSLSTIDRNFMALESCGMIILTLSFLFAVSRYPLFDVKTAVRRDSSSVLTVVIVGLYIISLAVISYISAAAGLPYDRFGIYVLAVFVAFLVLATAVSGTARRRLRRFLNENFYFERYNYRKEWRHYARLMASSHNIDDFISNTISSLCETVMVKKGLMWVNAGGNKASTYGLHENDWDESSVKELLDFYSGEPVRIFRRRGREWKHAHKPGESQHSPEGIYDWIEAMAFLGHDDEMRGFIALGRKEMNTGYSMEDWNFLSSVSDQALLTLENLLMEERFLESRQMESFNRFASFVIHDLKNTVGMLSLTAENARDNMEDKEFQEDAIVTINRSVEKMRKLIDSLNAHKSPATINRVATDISRLLDKKKDSLSEMAASRSIALKADYPRGLSAEVDRQAMDRIVENLALNAIESTPAGGTVTISASYDEDAGLRIEVSDTGGGFDPVYLEDHLFKPFSSTKKNGLGIGLVLCKTLTESHGGSIAISNNPGTGASVSVILPLRDSGKPVEDDGQKR